MDILMEDFQKNFTLSVTAIRPLLEWSVQKLLLSESPLTR